jgi:FkbM family methyltransferase
MVLNKLSIPLFLLKKICHHYPLYRGRDKITKLNPVIALFHRKQYDIAAKLKNGMKIMINPCDFDGRQIFLFGAMDPEIVEICKKLLNECDVFLDIGANYGSVGLNCASHSNKDGMVHFFEPQPDLCERLRNCLASNPNIKGVVHEIGLMDSDGEIDLIKSWHSGEASFVPPKDPTKVKDTIKVKIADISTYVPPIVQDRPFAVKMDVEGSELILLPWLVKQRNLKFLVFESMHISNKNRLFEIIKDVEGLTIYGISIKMFSWSLKPIIRSTDFNLFKDVIVFHKNFIPEVQKHFVLSQDN